MSEQLKSILDAPCDGTVIMGVNADGTDEVLIRWAKERRCMIAGSAGGNGYFGAGWEDDLKNHQTLCSCIKIAKVE